MGRSGPIFEVSLCSEDSESLVDGTLTKKTFRNSKCDYCNRWTQKKVLEIKPERSTYPLHFCIGPCIPNGIDNMIRFCIATGKKYKPSKFEIKKIDNVKIEENLEFFLRIQEEEKAIKETQEIAINNGEVLENNSMNVTMSMWINKTDIFRPISKGISISYDDYDELDKRIRPIVGL